MARSKARKKTPPTASAPRRSFMAAARDGFRFRDYLVLNLVFWAFCIVQLVFVRILLRDFAGIYFFFVFLMISFLIVSLFDYFANRAGIGDQVGDSSETINE